MRLNKLFIATLLAFSTLALQSCLKDQEDIFDESSSERMQAVLENTKAVLTSSDNGWIFDYYPDRNLSYGGCVYVLKFDNKMSPPATRLNRILWKQVPTSSIPTTDLCSRSTHTIPSYTTSPLHQVVNTKRKTETSNS